MPHCSRTTRRYVFSAALLMLAAHSSHLYAESESRPESWASVVSQIELDNLYQVDQGLFRSAQPDDDEFQALEKFGIKEVLNLRQFHTDRDEAKGTAIKQHQVPLDAGFLNEMDMLQALKVIKQRQGPMLVHCWHGADRTGAVIAAYRIVFQDWSKKQAIDELMNGGYGFHKTFYSNIPKLIEGLDVEYLRKELGLIQS